MVPGSVVQAHVCCELCLLSARVPLDSQVGAPRWAALWHPHPPGPGLGTLTSANSGPFRGEFLGKARTTGNLSETETPAHYSAREEGQREG